MSVFDRFRKPEPEGEPPLELPVLCYQTAYFLLPQLLFADAERTIGYFTRNAFPAGPYFYAMATRFLKVEGNREDALSFQAHIIELADELRCYILEYPKPPAVDLSQRAAVLAPFFSAIIRGQAAFDVRYHVLGQSPAGGTTFRAVTSELMNANLGPGPLPELDAFVAFLKERA